MANRGEIPMSGKGDFTWYPRPVLLDLFCGAGGAAMGYHRAGFDVIGVDIKPQPRYPFRFVQGDAMDVLASWDILPPFAAVHASPVCKRWTVAGSWHRAQGVEYPDQIGPTRARLAAAGVPWIIENVPGAPVRPDYQLCGCQFGLEVRRERWFETSWQGFDLRAPCHHVGLAITVCGHGEPSHGARRRRGLTQPTADDWGRAMGIDWMSRDELAQAIPPAYTQFLGEQLLAHITARAAA